MRNAQSESLRDLPTLRHGLKIFASQPDEVTGEPTGLLHDLLSNTYYRLSWAECEIIARFPLHRTVDGLIADVNNSTSLSLDGSDLAHFLQFLVDNRLVETGQGAPPFRAARADYLRWVLSRYLYFTLPLWRPQKFLDASLPFVRPLLSPTATRVMVGVFGLAAFLTLRRIDEFFATVPDHVGASLVVSVALCFAAVKIVHEWAHAWTATKYGVPVPHMGVAMIVMYPVLYTETSGIWRLGNKWHRMEIAFAGIRAEFFVATIFLCLWNLTAAGSALNLVSFYMIAVSMISSLLVNLNPLMRFDGYYLFSDFTGIENLQSRSCAFARYAIREFLFRPRDPAPEDLPQEKKNLLTGFGLALLVYRFFLFSGIAILVYHMFFQPLGLFLFLVEIWFFILRPVVDELKVWISRRAAFFSSRRGRFTAAMVAALLVFCFLPVQRGIVAPAVAYHRHYWQAHAPVVADVEVVQVTQAQKVRAGDVLMRLSSPSLVRDMTLARAKLQSLEMQKRQRVAGTSSPSSGSMQDIEEQIILIRKEIAKLTAQSEQLVLRAPFDGEVRDMIDGMREGRTVSPADVLFRIVDPRDLVYEAYISDMDRERVDPKAEARFFARANPFRSTPVSIETIDVTGSGGIISPELQEDLAGTVQQEGASGEKASLAPRQGMYRVLLRPLSAEEQADDRFLMKVKGQIYLQGQARSLAVLAWHRVRGLVLRETGF